MPIPGIDNLAALGSAFQSVLINGVVARQYGVEVPEGSPAYWVEKWDQDKFKITINDKPICYSKNNVDMKGEGNKPWDRIVPIVYIPQIRAGNFYGQNNIDHLKGIVKELNLRFADFGGCRQQRC